jgi:hypothetical protein
MKIDPEPCFVVLPTLLLTLIHRDGMGCTQRGPEVPGSNPNFGRGLLGFFWEIVFLSVCACVCACVHACVQVAVEWMGAGAHA